MTTSWNPLKHRIGVELEKGSEQKLATDIEGVDVWSRGGMGNYAAIGVFVFIRAANPLGR